MTFSATLLGYSFCIILVGGDMEGDSTWKKVVYSVGPYVFGFMLFLVFAEENMFILFGKYWRERRNFHTGNSHLKSLFLFIEVDHILYKRG